MVRGDQVNFPGGGRNPTESQQVKLKDLGEGSIAEASKKKGSSVIPLSEAGQGHATTLEAQDHPPGHSLEHNKSSYLW